MDVRYDMISAYEQGIYTHPQKQMELLGLRYSKSEPCPIADCWFFELTEEVTELPSYITRLDRRWFE